MIKITGFLTSHNKNASCSSDLEKWLTEKNDYSLVSDKIIEYLAKGITIESVMDWLCDSDGEAIGSYKIQTDGSWIWPSYYIYYLKKYPKIFIPNSLIDHIASNNYTVPNLSHNTKVYIEYLLIDILKIRTPNGWQPPKEYRAFLQSKDKSYECY